MVARWVLAAVFLFSGFVKAADPGGMALKLNAYLRYVGGNLPDDSLWLLGASVLLATVEFMLGVYLLLGIRRRLTVKCTLLIMVLMTAVTAWIYAFNPVPDCGCFGEALKLSHGQTLAKNVVLLLLAMFLQHRRWAPRRFISERHQWVVSVYSICYIVVLGIYAAHYLPPIDFTPYRLGTHLPTAMQGEMRTLFVYEKDGEQREFSEDALPEEPWKFVDARTEVLKAPEAVDFSLSSFGQAEDLTEQVLADSGYTFLLTLPHAETADDGNTDRINDIYDFCRDAGHAFYGLTASGEEAVENWKDRTGAAYSFLCSSDETIKAMVRATPGLMLLHEGRIVGKWSHNALPEDIEAGGIERLEREQMSEGGLSPSLRLLLLYVGPLLFVLLFDALWVGSKYYKRYTIKKHLNQKKMRKKIVAGNWKMNLNLQEGVALAKELNAALTADKPNCDVVICTPFIHLASVAGELTEGLIGLGAENCADKVSGAYTGEVSAAMVKSTGAQYVILGHSERRSYYGETEEILKEKTNLALANDLKVIFCIGEVLEERESGKQNEVVKAQIEGSLFDLSVEELSNIILAYEPVWAIGTGKTATAEQAEEMHAFIRGVIAEKFGAEAAENISILYGGSCKPSNAKEIFSKENVDGGLIGGAALKVADFKGIIDAWK